MNLRSKLAYLSVAFFFIATPLIIGLSFYTLYTLDTEKNVDTNNVLGISSPQIFAALPDKSPSTSIKLISSDARGDILKEYLTTYDSPLSPYSYYIVNVADEFNIDFRLITAIAQQESNLCKFIPDNTYNCWGWGIHSRGTLGFDSYEEGIKVVTEGISKEYLAKGYSTPDEIMKKYTPLSNGSWASAVNQFIKEME